MQIENKYRPTRQRGSVLWPCWKRRKDSHVRALNDETSCVPIGGGMTGNEPRAGDCRRPIEKRRESEKTKLKNIFKKKIIILIELNSFKIK